MEKDVVIIGAGLAGLRCAGLLERAGLDVLLLEGAEAPGGRVRTDEVEGFRLDRGFQVLLTAYPETRAALQYRGLRLKRLLPGALVWHGGRMHRFADPWREPVAAARFLFDDVVLLRDKLLVAALRARVRSGQPSDLFPRAELPTYAYLRKFGFSARMVERFFSPFFGGVFLEQELVTSSRYFQFLFRMFAAGAVAVPAEGMEQIPQQLAARLKPETLQTGTRVTSLARRAQRFAVMLADGRVIEAKQVVLAVAEHDQRPLLTEILSPKRAQAREPREWNRTTTLYYAAATSPVAGPILVLNGEGPGAGPINNLAVMSQVSRRYAPPGQELISVSCVGTSPGDNEGMSALEGKVREQAAQWFGPQVESWRLLAGYPIPHALPLARTTQWESTTPRLTDNVYICSDAQEQPSLQGALSSGRRTAEAILSQRGARD
ncbi:MAG TPA: NAD(P)/FAD-dependent oxidoreductase [Acidobacteriaceae bacterium]